MPSPAPARAYSGTVEQIFKRIREDASDPYHKTAVLLNSEWIAAQQAVRSAEAKLNSAPANLRKLRENELNKARTSLRAVVEKITQFVQGLPNVKIVTSQVVTKTPKVSPSASNTQLAAAGALRKQRIAVLQQRQNVIEAKDPATRALAMKLLLHEAKKLSLLTPKRKSLRSYEQVSEAKAKLLMASLTKKLAELKNRLAALKAFSPASPAQAAVRTAQIREIELQIVGIERKIAHLRVGVQRRHPPIITSSQAGVTRPKIPQPPAQNKPPLQGDLIAALLERLLAALPKGEKETAEEYRNRLEQYLLRAVARALALMGFGATEQQAVTQATNDTLTQDSAALEAEANAGGVVEDPAVQEIQDTVDIIAGEGLDELEQQLEQVDSVTTESVDQVVVDAANAEEVLASGNDPAVVSVDSSPEVPAVTEAVTTVVPEPTADNEVSTFVPVETTTTSTAQPLTQTTEYETVVQDSTTPAYMTDGGATGASGAGGAGGTTTTPETVVPVAPPEPTVVPTEPVQLPPELIYVQPPLDPVVGPTVPLVPASIKPVVEQPFYKRPVVIASAVGLALAWVYREELKKMVGGR